MSGGSGRRNSPKDCGGDDDPAGVAYVPSGVGVFPNHIKRPRERILKDSTSPKMFFRKKIYIIFAYANYAEYK